MVSPLFPFIRKCIPYERENPRFRGFEYVGKRRINMVDKMQRFNLEELMDLALWEQMPKAT
ncbi:hypothetical protein QF031_000947 [Pseudarthrobacter defluvii]|nr:hypothetical protein [Pseudarthrobacter defluvii]